MKEDRRTKVQEFQASNYVFLSARDKREAELIASTKEEEEFFKKPGLEVIISIKPAPERKPRNSSLCSGVGMIMPGAVPNP
jgi:hypothetical protein